MDFMVCGVACLLLLVSAKDGEAGLSSYVGKDLAKLSKEESEQFAGRLRAIVNEKPDPSAWQIPVPRWIKRYRIGGSEWLLLSYIEAMSVPGSGTVQVYGFTKDWHVTFKSLFSTGYRLSPTSVTLIDLPDLAQPVLRIHVESLGPFLVQGDSKRPAFHPASGMDLYCAFNDLGGYLIRLTTGDGKLIGNSFHGGFSSSGGPDGPPRQVTAWKNDLNAADPVRQLYAIMWLSSTHLNSKDWRKKGFARESVASSLSFEKLRADPTVTTRLRTLQKSSNQWVREQSAFALERLAQPLTPVESAPDWG